MMLPTLCPAVQEPCSGDNAHETKPAGFSTFYVAKTKKAFTCCVAGGSMTEKRSMKEILVDECLKNPQTLLFAMSYFCVYVRALPSCCFLLSCLISASA